MSERAFSAAVDSGPTAQSSTPRATLRAARSIVLGFSTTLSLTLRRKIRRLPISALTDEYAFSYGAGGWHYFRALLAEYDRHPTVDPRRTTFYQFFQHERVRSVRYLEDILFFHDRGGRWDDDGHHFFFGTYPWGDWGKTESTVGGTPWGYYYDRLHRAHTRDLYGYRRNPWYEPGDPYPLDVEWKQTIRLYHALRRGYFPLLHGSLPSVILLVRRDGQIRAVRRNGNHRLSILAHLGHQRVTVWIAPDSVEEVRESEVDDWYYVKRGICSRQHALAIFNAYFELNGRERVEALGIPPAY